MQFTLREKACGKEKTATDMELIEMCTERTDDYSKKNLSRMTREAKK